MTDDLSRPARLPSEAIALPAMEPAQGRRTRGNGALGAVRRDWPSMEPEQHMIPAGWENGRAGAEGTDGLPAADSIAGTLTMGRAALHSVLSVKRR